jgi:membrane protease YdiL (CAAX protease family)
VTSSLLPALLILVWLIAIAAPPFVEAAYRRRHAGHTLFAPRWSVLHLWYALNGILLTLIVLTFGYFVFLGMLAPLLKLSLPRLTKAIAAQDFRDVSALLLFFLPVTVLQNIAFFGVPAGFINVWYGEPLRRIGLPLLPPRRAVVSGLILGVAVLLLSSLTGFGVEKLAEHFRYLPWVARMLDYERTNAVAQMASSLHHSGPLGLILGFFTVAIAAPLGEEMLFRGFALSALARRFGQGWGIVLSALLFAAPHSYSLLGISVIFLMGLILGYVYRTGGSLWTVILIHAVNNGAQILVAYFLP